MVGLTPPIIPGVMTLPFEEMIVGLESPSELQIMADDVIEECHPIDPEACDSIDHRWAEMKVGEQVAA